MSANEILLYRECIIMQNIFHNIFSIHIHTENLMYPIDYVTLIIL